MYRTVVVTTLSVLTMLTCGPSFADDIFKKAEKSAEGAVKGAENAATHPGRSAECAQGDTKVQRKIARDTVGYAKTHWKIAELTNAADTSRAEGELYDFLSWTLGNPSLVCAQYITAGQNHFNNSFNTAAAAALLGANLPGGGRPQFSLPPSVSTELKRTIKECEQAILNASNQATSATASAGAGAPTGAQSKTTDPKKILDDRAAAALHKELQGLSQKCVEQVNQLKAQIQQAGFPPELVDQYVVQVAAAGVKFVDRVGFNMPKDYSMKRETVLKLIAARQKSHAAR
ncbi:MAG: hypothetical protein DME04_15445 [Candidatus Rokuibacteriota bacterium]|nr:MAG: hypothetical protein DME04_15445 [Candidatus Rokubacteria bacterium]